MPHRRIESVPDEQTLAFGRAVCLRLGIDPSLVDAGSLSVDVPAGGDQGAITLTAYLPAEELLTLLMEVVDPE